MVFHLRDGVVRMLESLDCTDVAVVVPPLILEFRTVRVCIEANEEEQGTTALMKKSRTIYVFTVTT